VRLRFLIATKKHALWAVLLLGVLPAVAAAASTGAFTAARAKVASAVELIISPSHVGQGDTVTFVATVKIAGAPAPAGTPVLFGVDGTEIATSATSAKGIARFSTSVATYSGTTIAGGTHRVSATYAGSATVKRSRALKKLLVRCPGTRGACESLLADPSPAVGTPVYPGQPLTIVAINDGPIGTSGTLAPSALLSTGQSLDVMTAATSGQPAHYITSHRRPRSANNQLLLSFALPGDLAPGSHTILVTAFEGDNDSDQWYWPITVLAIPPAVPYSIEGTVTTPLYPGGGSAPINLRFLNPNPGNGGSGAVGVQVSSLTVTVAAVSAPAATPALPCTVSDFAVSQFSGAYPFVIPEGRSSLRSLGFAPRTWPSVRLVGRPVNQNGCKGATITLTYAGAS